MDLKPYANKLIGNDTERAVSPVIGVILMVAITVILAAVIAAFVLDLGGSVSQEAQAGVDIEVDEETEEVTISITSSGNADDFELAGDADGTVGSVNDDLSGAGDVVTITHNNPPSSSAPQALGSDTTGTVTVVAIIDEDGTQTQVASEDFDF